MVYTPDGNDAIKPQKKKLNMVKSSFRFLLTLLIVVYFVVMTNIFPISSDTLASYQKQMIHHQHNRIHQTIPYQPFNTTNPYKHSWCPYAKCYNSPTCAPCNRRFLFIIATGRSGSTTLLEMFNQLPNTRISGENWNMLYKASGLTRAFESHPEHFVDMDMIEKGGPFMHEPITSGPFQHNAMPVGSIACVVQSVVHFLNPPPMDAENLLTDKHDEAGKILGMKIIRLQASDWTLERAVRYLKESFPCARFIMNIRSDTSEQVKSMVGLSFFGGDRAKTMEHVKKQTSFLMELARRLGSKTPKRSRVIDFSKWKTDVSILNDVVNWLGFEGCEFKEILHENHGRYGQDKRKLDLGERCRLPEP